MGILDELKKLTHPYDDEDEEYEDFEEPRERSFDDRRNKAEDRRNKVVNIHATTQLKVVLVKPDRFENASKIKKVAANTYIITPYHVELEGDLIDELENNGLYF